MKYNLFIGIFALISVSLHAQDKDRLYQTKSLTNDNIQQVEVKTTGGNITIMGTNASESRIEVYVMPSNSRDRDMSKEEIQKRLKDEYTLSISVTDHKLIAIAKPNSDHFNWNRGLNVSFKLFVPTSASSELSTSGGNINLSNLSGTENFTTSGGNISVESLSGKTKGRTSGGNIYLRNSSDNLELTTSGGNIQADKSSGQIKLSTSGGDIILTNLTGMIKATTSGGNVKADGIDGELYTGTSGGNLRLQNLACTLDAGTSGGNITVSMKKMGKYLKLHNSGGSTDLDLPGGIGMNLDLLAEKVKVNSMSNFSGNTDEHHMEGKLNGGGVPVTVSGGDRINVTVR